MSASFKDPNNNYTPVMVVRASTTFRNIDATTAQRIQLKKRHAYTLSCRSADAIQVAVVARNADATDFFAIGTGNRWDFGTDQEQDLDLVMAQGGSADLIEY